MDETDGFVTIGHLNSASSKERFLQDFLVILKPKLQNCKKILKQTVLHEH